MYSNISYFIKKSYIVCVNEIDAALGRLPIRLWRRMVRTLHSKTHQVEMALLPLGLTMTEFDMLAVLRSLGESTQQELAHRMLFTEANMSYHAKRMVNRGLIQRQTSGKRKLLSVTEQGCTLIEEALPLVIAIHEQQFSDLTEAEMLTLQGLLRRLQ